MIPKLLIVDDHEVVRVGLAALLETSEISVVGSAGNAEQAASLAESLQPNVVLLDIRMAGTDGLGAMNAIQKVAPDARFVILSTYDNPTYVARSVALGASDYVLKGSSRERILSALLKVAHRENIGSDSLLYRVRKKMQQTEVCKAAENLPITTRELQVLRHVALGLSNKEIAKSLDISVETVKEHVQNLLRKLKAADRTDAAVQAVKLGVV